MRPQPYSSVTFTPNGTRCEWTAPQPLQFVPQPSMIVTQALLNESTARVSAADLVNQGDQADNAIKNMAIQIPNDNLLRMMRLLSLEGRIHAQNRSCVYRVYFYIVPHACLHA
jgi:hypothetical protein